MNSEKVKINSFLNVQAIDAKSMVDMIVPKIEDSDIGFAGFENPEQLTRALFYEVEGDAKKTKKIDLEKGVLELEVKKTATRCQSIIPTNETHIFLFPTFSDFVKDKMNGISGFTPWKNTIHIYINYLGKNWQQVLNGTIFHEYCHSVMFHFHEWNTNLDTLIFEGMAELFREENFGGENPPWISIFSVEECRKIFSAIYFRLGESGLFETNNLDLHIWTKYTLGYQIVKSFRKKHPTISWPDLIKISPKEILDGSEYSSPPLGI